MRNKVIVRIMVKAGKVSATPISTPWGRIMPASSASKKRVTDRLK
jgi:hypothetical protein